MPRNEASIPQPHWSSAEAEAWPRLLFRCEDTGRLRLRDDHEPRLIEVLARIAAQLAGRDPDEPVKIEYGGTTAFEAKMWLYPDFIERARKALAALAS